MGKPLVALALLSAAFTAQPAVNVLRVAGIVKDGETITIGSQVFEVDFDTEPTITAGRNRIDLSAAPSVVAAFGTLTFAGNAVAAETVTINGQVYTWAAVVGAANTVLVGANAAASIVNLVAAINATPASAGVLFGAATVANAGVTAVDGAGDTVVVTARAKGTVGNAITTTEGMTNASWGGATLASGADATAAHFVDAFVLAVAAVDAGVQAFDISDNEVLVVSTRQSTAAAATTETMATANNAWANATMVGGGPGGEETLQATRAVKRAATATEVALGSMHFMFTFTPTVVIPHLRTAAGVFKAWDGAVTITGKRVTLNNAGSADWADTDVMHLVAYA